VKEKRRKYLQKSSERFLYHVRKKKMFFNLPVFMLSIKSFASTFSPYPYIYFGTRMLKKTIFVSLILAPPPFLAIITVATSFPSLLFFLFSVL
jgi:hypothetical protein